MYVRELNQQEILPALHLVWEVFAEEVAVCYTPEGVAEFQRFIKFENMNRMYRAGEIVMFGAFDGGALAGVISVKSVGHICLFFVKHTYQGRGVGRMLFQAVQNHCIQKLRTGRITVNAAPGAVLKYIHMGMRQTGAERTENGIRYVPMEMYVNLMPMQQARKRNDTPLIIGIIIAVLVFGLLIFGGITAVIWSVFRGSAEERNWERYQEEWWEDDFFDDNYTSLPREEEKIGLDAIEAHIEENLPYEICEDSYAFYDSEKLYTTIDFDVDYPRLSGLDSGIEESVNQVLEGCAMETVDKIYQNPSEEMKERVLKAEYPMLVSYVDFKVCFASEDFISVAFEDNNCQGNGDEYYQNLRTVNISLKDGRVYRLEELVDIENDAFTELWLERMQEGEGNGGYFSELSEEEIKKTLAGDSLGGVYVVNFFLDNEGINIGYDLNYQKGDRYDIGYSWLVTALTGDEIADYVKLPELWKWLGDEFGTG